MKGLSRKLRKYVLTLSTVMMLVLLSAVSVFATETSDNKVVLEETDTVIATEAQAVAVLEKTELKLENESWIYSGDIITPEVKLVYNNEDGTERDVTDLFVCDMQYSNNINVGEALVSVEISGYYTEDEIDSEGERAAERFETSIKKEAVFDIEAASLSGISLSQSSYIYSGEENTPEVIVKSGDKELEDTDYVVTYENNVDVGTAVVTVTGTGNYKGELSVDFTIKAAELSALTLSQTSYIYNGAARKPETTVISNGKTLVRNADYTVTYKNNTNAGTATVTVTGKNNYTGTKTANFTIAKADISEATVKLSCTKYAYTGNDRKPGITVTMKLSSASAVTLKNNTDYTVTYSSNCKSIGTKTVLIKGKDNYTGSIKKTYTVVPENASGLKVSKRTTSSLTVACTKAKVSGCKYQFRLMKYNSTTEEWEQKGLKNSTSNSVAFSGLSAGSVYYVYARIYKTGSSANYWGSWSNALKTVTTPAKTVVSSAVRTAPKTIKVTWKAVSSATGYEIQYAANSKFSSAKTVKVNGRTTTSKSISVSSASSTYYVRVRAYRTYGGSTYRGAWSSSKSTAWTNVYATYTTTYNSGNTNRSTNLRLACQAINGKVLANGATFSFNGIVGERTAAKGYKEAIIYEGGQEVGGIGGGICQVATTLFNAALKANFTIVERYQHSLTVHYAPLGYDAAIAWGSKNLRFRNNSGVSVKVSAVASGGKLQVKFLTNTYKKPPTVTTKVTKRNGVYTLKRYVNGKCNYKTTSNYLDD